MGRAGLRASDADREQVAERLRQATADGRLFADELEQRLATALRARTFGELDAVVADLPGGVSRSRKSDALALAKPVLAVAILIPIIVAAVFVITSMLAIWALWAVAGWWFFGHRVMSCGHGRGVGRGVGRGGIGRGMARGGVGRGGVGRGQTRPGFWL